METLHFIRYTRPTGHRAELITYNIHEAVRRLLAVGCTGIRVVR